LGRLGYTPTNIIQGKSVNTKKYSIVPLYNAASIISADRASFQALDIFGQLAVMAG